MSYTLQDLAFGVGGTSANPVGGVWSKLARRSPADLIAGGLYQWLQDGILELSRDYRFADLEKTGPTVPMVTGQTAYTNDYMIQVGDAGRITNLVPSFFRYFITSLSVGTNNPGSTLDWKTIDALELMFNIPGIPTYFTRYSNSWMLAPSPNQAYLMYLRYQVEHPFSTPVAATDPFLLDNDWKEIAEYAAAIRGANALRMTDYAAQYHNTIFGDPEFQASSGRKGMPGLIFRRTIQMESDSTSMPKSIRAMVSRTISR